MEMGYWNGKIQIEELKSKNWIWNGIMEMEKWK